MIGVGTGKVKLQQKNQKINLCKKRNQSKKIA